MLFMEERKVVKGKWKERGDNLQNSSMAFILEGSRYQPQSAINSLNTCK